jgi:hypothetical protein
MRLALRWAVRLTRVSGPEVQGETRNVSSEGFYCAVPEVFSEGEPLECAIKIPTPPSSGSHRYMNCRCTVLRIEQVGTHLFGIACRINAYTVASDDSQ